MDIVTSYLVHATVPLAVKTALYAAAFKLRHHTVKVMTCFILAGVPLMVGMIPIPSLLLPVAQIILAVILLTQFTEVDPYPEGIVIIVGVEAVSWMATEWIIFPLVG